MKLQIIKDIHGRDEYVLLPMQVYEALREKIEEQLGALEKTPNQVEYKPFIYNPYHLRKNPVAQARIEARITKAELAKRMGVSQVSVTKLEHANQVSKEAMDKVLAALGLVAQIGEQTPTPNLEHCQKTP